MTSDNILTRTIQNTDKIKSFLKDFLSLLNENTELADKITKKSIENELEQEYVQLRFLKELKAEWNKINNEKRVYIHELLIGSDLYLPKYEPEPRSPELDARIERIKAQLDEEEYRRMVSNVDLNSPLRNKDKIKASAVFPEFKTAQGQLIAIFNVFAVIGGSFVFGYKAVEYSLDEPNVSKQMMGGLLLAIIVAIADFYFLFKKLLHEEKKEEIEAAAKKTKIDEKKAGQKVKANKKKD